MPFTKTSVCEIVEFICKKNKIDCKKAFTQLEKADLFKMEPLWASRQAKKYATDNELDFTKLEHIKGRRIILDDVKEALGEEIPEKVEKKSIFPFASSAAFNESVIYKLKAEEFTEDEKTGLTRKNKEKILITIDDVRKKAGITVKGKYKNIFASKKAEEYAKEMVEEYNIDLEKIEKTGHKGKIRKKDIDEYLVSIESKEDNESQKTVDVIDEEIQQAEESDEEIQQAEESDEEIQQAEESDEEIQQAEESDEEIQQEN